MESYTYPLAAVLILLIGFFLGRFLQKGKLKKLLEITKKNAEEIIKKAQLDAESTK